MSAAPVVRRAAEVPACPLGPGVAVRELENTGPVPLEVLGVFHPAGSPAATRDS